jgi:hypothetical protein
MLSANRASFAVGCAAAMVATAGAGQHTITLTEELRTAFYEHAPSRMATGIESAVHSYCKSTSKGPTAAASSPTASQSGWLCTSRHLYLRNVYLNGTKGNHGLVCDDTGLLKLRFIGVDLAAEQVKAHTCMPVAFDGSVFQVALSSDLNHGDT